MTEIKHRQLVSLIRNAVAADLSSIWLLHGEQVLVERSAATIIDHLMTADAQKLGIGSLEGTVENIPDLLEQMNTLALLSGNKVMLFKNARLFEARANATDLIRQIEQACRDEQPARAGRLLLELSSRTGQNLEDLLNEPGSEGSAIEPLRKTLGQDAFNSALHHALNQSGSAGGGDNIDSLLRAIEKGFPRGHFLIVTLYSKAPKNYKLYKSIEKHGLIVDCSVPAGERRADKTAQESVLRESWDELLQKAAKTAEAGVFEAVSQLIGFDLSTFCQSTEKLIDYSGARAQIAMNDVQHVLRRTRTDPIYDLTNAVADRNLPQALFYLHSLQSDWHPLQIVAALANQIRRLLIARDFIDSDLGNGFQAGISYAQFQDRVMPAVLAYDAQVQNLTAAWQSDSAAPGPDMRLAAQPKNAYPVFQTLNKAQKFSREELAGSLECLSRADIMLKSSGQSAALVLTRALQFVCRQGVRRILT